MKSVILTEGTETVADESEDIDLVHYFRGQFRQVADLANKLAEVTDTEVYIFSDEFGLCRGSTQLSEVNLSTDDISTRAGQKTILNAVEHADVVAFLFTNDSFNEYAKPIWSKVTETAKPGSIWAIGLSQSALNSVDIEPLRHKCNLIVYRRVGVVRIDIETRENLLKTVQDRANDINVRK